MPSAETSAAFFLVAILLGFTPGPDNLFVLMQSIVHGRRAGLLVVAGLCLGICVHTAAVALGLAAVVATSQTAFVLLKVAGAAYLGYLAWKAFRAPAGGLNEADTGRPDHATLFRRAVGMNLTNPKVLLFFLAFLPQFVAPSAGPVSGQVAWFGFCFIVATVISFGTIALAAGYIGRWLRRSSRAQVALNRACGLVFAGLAVLGAASRNDHQQRRLSC